MRRGRRHPTDLRPGDPLDFWRVEAYEENRLLSLKAEMKLPVRRGFNLKSSPLKKAVG